jgi:hypothetical protein
MKGKSKRYEPRRDVFAKYIEETEACFDIFVGVGTARRLLLGRTELKKLAIVPVIVGLREGMMQKTVSKGRV